MNYRKLQMILVFMTALLLTACDPAVEFERVIENRSSYDIVILSQDSLYPAYNADSGMVHAGATRVIQQFTSIGTVSKFSYCGVGEGEIRFLVPGFDSLEVTKDPTIHDDWNYCILEVTRFQGGSCRCSLIISDATIE